MSRHAIEQSLVELRDQIAWPQERDISSEVGRRVALSPPRRAPSRRWIPAAVALLLAVTALLLLSPQARKAVADLLGVAGIEIGAVPDIDEILLGWLDPGDPVSREAVGGAVSFPVSVPGAVGEPSAIFVSRRSTGDLVTMVWEGDGELPAAAGTGIGLLYDQFVPDPKGGGLVKAYGRGTVVEFVAIGESNAFWIEGAPHLIVYEDASGNRVEESARLAGNVLVWEAGGVTHRLETLADLETALGIAESLQPLSPPGS